MAEETEPPVIVQGDAKGFAQKIDIGPHHIGADEPASFGGTDSGASPYDLILAALGACTSMTIGFYARKRNWPVDKITVSLRHSKIHARDCDDCETKEGRIDRINMEIHLDGALTDEQRAKLMEVAGKCPVHQTLTSEINIKTRAV
jgi:putative redox protein